MARALKVFRTAAGFHDAYVAAPSRKAALKAWGSDVDLFARGIAEEISDPALTAEPLENPGEVIMLSRGGLADQLNALGPRKRVAKGANKQNKSAKPAKKPSRTRLDKAEAALAQAERRQAEEMKELEIEQAKLERKIDAATARHEREIAPLERRRRTAEENYSDALDAWCGSS